MFQTAPVVAVRYQPYSTSTSTQHLLMQTMYKEAGPTITPTTNEWPAWSRKQVVSKAWEALVTHLFCITFFILLLLLFLFFVFFILFVNFIHTHIVGLREELRRD